MNDICYIIKVNNKYFDNYGRLTDFRSEAKDYKSLTWAIKRYHEFKNLGCKVTVFKYKKPEYVWPGKSEYVWPGDEISEFNIEDYMLQRKVKLI